MDVVRAIPVKGSPRMAEAPTVNGDDPSGSAPPGGTPDFVDVSHHDKNIDWDKYAGSGRQVAICKATESTDWADEMAPVHRAALGKLGLYCGLYHFAGASGAQEIADPVVEADFFSDTVGALGAKEFPVLDFEFPYKMTPDQQVSWIGKWCVEVEKKTGKTPWVYTNSSMLRKMDAASLTRFPLWLANYQSNDPRNPPSSGSWPSLTAWQYTYKASVPGLGPCDDSFLYADLGAVTGGPAPGPAPVPGPVPPAPEPVPPVPEPVPSGPSPTPPQPGNGSVPPPPT